MCRPNQATNLVIAQLLDQHGLGPAGDPVGWDYRQRAFDDHWAAGGTARSFVDRVLAEEQAVRSLAGVPTDPASFGVGRLTGMQARRYLERRYPSP